MEIVKRIAWFWKPIDIKEDFEKTSGKTIAAQTIVDYSKTEKWQPIIEKLRDDYNKAMYDVPLFHKRKRLDELQKHYDRHMNSGKWKEAQSVLRDARDEVDQKFGDVSFHFTNVTQYNEMSDEQIAEEKGKILEQLDRAQRMKKLLENKGN